jgi:hypothetical protein
MSCNFCDPCSFNDVLNERQGEAFYQDLLEHVEDSGGKEVFQTLADEEVEHVRMLQAEIESIQKDREWLALDEARTCEPVTPLEIFPEKRNAALSISPNLKDVDALKMAMAFEEKRRPHSGMRPSHERVFPSARQTAEIGAC